MNFACSVNNEYLGKFFIHVDVLAEEIRPTDAKVLDLHHTDKIVLVLLEIVICDVALNDM